MDGRGKHDNRKIISEDEEEVRNHIKSFSQIESHYLRTQTNREFLEGNLYRRIFNNEFNISFFKPKKDQCDLCTGCFALTSLP